MPDDWLGRYGRDAERHEVAAVDASRTARTSPVCGASIIWPPPMYDADVVDRGDAEEHEVARLQLG